MNKFKPLVAYERTAIEGKDTFQGLNRDFQMIIHISYVFS